MAKLIFIMILVVAVAWGALAFGVSGSQGNMTRATAAAKGWFGGLMTTRLAPRDLLVQGGCSVQGKDLRLAAGQSCRIAVRSGGFRVRRGKVLRQSGNGTVRFHPAPSRDPRPEPAAAKSPPVTLSVHGEGGTIDLTCRTGAECRFRLGAAP